MPMEKTPLYWTLYRQSEKIRLSIGVKTILWPISSMPIIGYRKINSRSLPIKVFGFGYPLAFQTLYFGGKENLSITLSIKFAQNGRSTHSLCHQLRVASYPKLLNTFYAHSMENN